MLLIFSQKVIVIHFCFAGNGSFFLVSYFGLPLSYNQNTEQDTLPCSKVSSKNKQKISLHSFPFFFRRHLKSGATDIKFKKSKP